MLRIYASTATEADAAWNMALGAQSPCEVHLDGVGLIARVERDAANRLRLRRTAAEPASAPHTAPPVRSPWR